MSIDQIDKCIEEIIHIIEIEKEKISNKRLVDICDKTGSLTSGEINPHFYHEIVETALNKLIKRKYTKILLNSGKPAEAVREILSPIAENLPTQTWRSRKQNLLQQFSTPPAIAYLLAYLMNFKQEDQVLEPSAGTGSLAIWSSGFGLTTYTNEIDLRRRELLSKLGFSPTSFNAEFINDFLPEKIKPNCLIMNPPFSSNGGRTKNNSSKFGFRHVSTALERLNSGGKFGILLGNSAGLDTRTGREYWKNMSDKIRIKAIIKIAGREYRKYGTNVDINLIIGTKLLKTQEKSNKATMNEITSLSIETIEEGFALLKKLNLRLN
jgi:predicted RNA methylase